MLLYILLFHIIGAVIYFNIQLHNGTMDEAIHDTRGEFEPVDVVFMSFIWELMVILQFMIWCVNSINEYFYNKG